jgi:hypothetical protein
MDIFLNHLLSNRINSDILLCQSRPYRAKKRYTFALATLSAVRGAAAASASRTQYSNDFSWSHTQAKQQTPLVSRRADRYFLSGFLPSCSALLIQCCRFAGIDCPVGRLQQPQTEIG